MELLNDQLFFINNLKNEKSKARWNARPNFPNKFHADGRTDGELTQNFTFSKFLQLECSRVPIHFEVAATGAARPLRENNFPYFLSYLTLKGKHKKILLNNRSDGTCNKFKKIYLIRGSMV